MNRRMQEYLDLVKKPVFAQTLIRVKLYDNWVFECRFSPLQTLQTLCDVFRDVTLSLFSAQRTKISTTISI